MTIDVSKIKVGDTIWVKAVVAMTSHYDIHRPFKAMVVDHPTNLERDDFWPKIENIVGWEKQKHLLRVGAIVRYKTWKHEGEVFAYDDKEVVIKSVDHGFVVLEIDDIEVLS